MNVAAFIDAFRPESVAQKIIVAMGEQNLPSQREE